MCSHPVGDEIYFQPETTSTSLLYNSKAMHLQNTFSAQQCDIFQNLADSYMRVYLGLYHFVFDCVDALRPMKQFSVMLRYILSS